MKPRLLYLHGFASGPESAKGVAVSERLAARGVAVERLDLRVPSPNALSFRAMCTAVKEAIGGRQDRALLIGSSLGGLVALRVAERDPRVTALVLMAPAVQIASRWRASIGEEAWARWMESGWFDLPDHRARGLSGVPASFGREIEALDAGMPAVSLPTWIAHGRNDTVVPIESSRALAEGRPHVSLLELDDEHDLRASIPALLDGIEDFLEARGVL